MELTTHHGPFWSLEAPRILTRNLWYAHQDEQGFMSSHLTAFQSAARNPCHVLPFHQIKKCFFNVISHLTSSTPFAMTIQKNPWSVPHLHSLRDDFSALTRSVGWFFCAPFVMMPPPCCSGTLQDPGGQCLPSSHQEQQHILPVQDHPHWCGIVHAACKRQWALRRDQAVVFAVWMKVVGLSACKCCDKCSLLSEAVDGLKVRLTKVQAFCWQSVVYGDGEAVCFVWCEASCGLLVPFGSSAVRMYIYLFWHVLTLH